MPHIAAANLPDLHFGFGFVHAQDRLWQMEMSRRAVAGRLSEMFGERTLDTDVFMRTLDLHGHAQRSLSALAPAERALIEAYAAGVNAYMTRRTNLLEPRWSPEFLLTGHRPEPWQAADCVAILKLMALVLSNNLREETTRLTLAARGLSTADIELLVPSTEPGLPPLPLLATLLPLRQAAARSPREFALIDGLIGTGASNNWVVGGTRTKSGKPLLANDPHLNLAAPSVWYLAHLSLQREGAAALDAVGGTLPGVPLIVLGRVEYAGVGLHQHRRRRAGPVHREGQPGQRRTST